MTKPSPEARKLAEKWRNPGWGEALFAEFIADIDRFAAEQVKTQTIKAYLAFAFVMFFGAAVFGLIRILVQP